MSDLGQLLKKARMEKGLSLDQLQDSTKIRKRYLEAIEEGNYKILPGNFYVRAFIKSYAEAVGLETGEVMRLYRNVIPDPNPEKSMEPIRRKRRSSANTERLNKWASAFLMWCFPLLILGIIYMYVSDKYEGKKSVDDPLPITENVGNNNLGNELEPTPDPIVEETPPQDTPDLETAPKQLVELIDTSGRIDVYAASNSDQLVVELSAANGDCWFEARDGGNGGKVLESLVLKRGEIRTWEIEDVFWIRLGAPGAVEITVNGTVLSTAHLTSAKNIQVDLIQPEETALVQ